jgi:SPX domain protein involved in polyphosphate accumulation
LTKSEIKQNKEGMNTEHDIKKLTICWREVEKTAVQAQMKPLALTLTSVTVQIPTPTTTTMTDAFTSLE